MQDVQQCFEYLIKKTEKLTHLNKTQKDLILRDLNYFLTQSKCHEDRRHNSQAIKNKWKEFKTKVLRTHLLIEPKGFFVTISDFVGISPSEFEDLREIERYEKFEVPEFFEDLIHAFENKKFFFTPEEQTIAFCGLKFLLSESKLPNSRRDHKGIWKVWLSIKPILERYGLFFRYTGAKGLSSKLRLFLTREL